MHYVYATPLVRGTLLRRYKRFLADVELDSGETVVAHSPNTGSMKGCAIPGSPVWLSRSHNPKRKLAWTWEITETQSSPVCVNTALPNRIVEAAIAAGDVEGLVGPIRREVRYGSERSRIDLLLGSEAEGLCYVEIKNVTLVEDGVAAFPDAVTARGQKHLRELAGMVAEGHRAVICYFVSRLDCRALRPADAIDPEYGRILRRVVAEGVEALALQARVTPEGIRVMGTLPVDLSTAD